MIKHFRKTISVIFLAVLLVACRKVETIQSLPSVDNTMTPIIVLLPTHTVVPTHTTVPPTSTPIPPEKANLACIPNQVIENWKLSPNGAWMTNGFYLKDEQDNLLQVIKLDCTKSWKIFLGSYKEKESFDHHDGFIPYRWSKDGKFLYATVGQRMSGCCWKGLRYVLLVRLDLETGEQIEIQSSNFAFDFIISDSDRYIAFTPSSDHPYDFAVLDQETQKTQEVKLEFKGDIDLIYAVMSPREDKIILPIFQNIEYDSFFINSIALVDLTTGKQELLVSGLTQNNELYPVRWVDESNMLLTNIDPKFNQDTQATVKYWLLNINSHQLKEVKP